MNEPILKVYNICINFNGVCALDDFSFSLRKGEILGLMGPNGAGKTTLFNVIGGFIKPAKGFVLFEKKEICQSHPYEISRLGVSRTFQKLRLIEQLSVLDNLLLAFRDNPGEKLVNTLFNWRKVSLHEQRNTERSLSLLTDVGLESYISTPAGDLSYGQQKLLNLVCCFASPAKLLLLDEPIAGVTPLTRDKVLTMINQISKEGTSIILIEHNVNALVKVSNRLLFMDAGKKVCEGEPKTVCNDNRVMEAYLG